MIVRLYAWFDYLCLEPPGRPGGIQVLEATISWRRPTNMNEEVDLTYTLTIMDMATNTTKVYQVCMNNAL